MRKRTVSKTAPSKKPAPRKTVGKPAPSKKVASKKPPASTKPLSPKAKNQMIKKKIKQKENDKDAVWAKATKIRGENPDIYRKDSEKNKIRYKSYGKTTDLGWEIDHKTPLAKGGSDALSNKQALQWKANRQKSDKIEKDKQSKKRPPKK